MHFDHWVMVDWSGGNDRGPTPCRDAIWIGEAGQDPLYCRNRAVAEAALTKRIAQALAGAERLLIGFDFPFGYPSGFARAVIGGNDPLTLWDWLEARIEDAPKANNRFDLAARLNRVLAVGQGPFWGNALRRDLPDLPRTKASYRNPFPDRRLCETRAKGAFPCWQLAGAGAVGSQVLMGLPVLARLRRRFAGQVAVWPFEPLTRSVAFVEIWPGLIAQPVKAATGPGDIRDAVQVRLLAGAMARLAPERLQAMLQVDAPEEGWILGLGHEKELCAACP